MKKNVMIGIVVGIIILGVVVFFLINFLGLSDEELRELCEAESWPPGGCSAVPDLQGRELCERCQGLTEGGKSELQELCEAETWPANCSIVPDSTGREFCERCKELLGLEDFEKIEPSDITQITFFKGVDVNSAFDPDWSSDGSQIVFGKEGELYIINSDGTGLTKIGPSSSSYNIYNPSWSPVDNRILCTGGEYSDLYIIDLDVDKTKTVTLGVQPALFQAWSPDGTKIVYSIYDDTNAPILYGYPQCKGIGIKSSIWVMNSDGTGKIQLTTDEDGYCSDPSFSPDSSKIVYNKGFINPSVPSLVEESPNEIWVMNVDGSNKHMIYTTGDSVYFLHQSAWGRNNKIIFEKMQLGELPQIWVMNSDGTNPIPIVRLELGTGSFLYADTALDNTGTKIVTTQWKSSILDGKEVPHSYVDRNVVTFSLEG